MEIFLWFVFSLRIVTFLLLYKCYQECFTHILVSLGYSKLLLSVFISKLDKIVASKNFTTAESIMTGLISFIHKYSLFSLLISISCFYFMINFRYFLDESNLIVTPLTIHNWEVEILFQIYMIIYCLCWFLRFGTKN